ncbi:MAG: alpha/beta hydrolase family protein [Acidimicrobiia bacterium]
MREQEVAVASGVGIAAVLCLPEEASAATPVPAVALIAGSGADTRDGDLVLEGGTPGDPPAPGTMRRIAHDLAGAGIASLRWDRRGFGRSGGDPAHVGYHTDVADALACVRWLRARPEIAGERVAVAGHSAGALVACRVCRDEPGIAGAGLLGALSSPIEDMLRWNVGRLRRHWVEFTDDQRAWLEANLPASLLRSEGMERLLEGAAAGEEVVRLEGRGVTLELPTTRLRQDLGTDYAAEMRAVRCPALVLHGGDDLNVPVEDALRTYGVLRDAGNDDVTLVVLPGLEHYFNPVSPDPGQRVWERVSLIALRRPMAHEALEAITRWALSVLGR